MTTINGQEIDESLQETIERQFFNPFGENKPRIFIEDDDISLSDLEDIDEYEIDGLL